MKQLYYYHPLVFSFRSGMTQQQTKNFIYFCDIGYHVHFFGTRSNVKDWDEIQRFIGKRDFSILAKKGSRKWRFLLDYLFLYQIAQDRSRGKIVVGRQLDTTEQLLRWRGLLGNPLVVMELHERAFPHLLTSEQSERAHLKAQTQRIFDRLDGLVLTNYSQEIILKQEFSILPAYTVASQAVQFKDFQGATRADYANNESSSTQPLFVTYTGHFGTWRDIENLFEALTYLEKRFHLRIAGGISSGISDEASRQFLEELGKQFGVRERVHYLGHVPRDELVEQVLCGSAVLALPLGDNLIAKYFTAPIKLMEYMSTRIPVVAVDFPSVSLLTGQDTVFLAENNPEAFARAIRNAIMAPDCEARIKRMNQVARQNSFEKRARHLDIWYSGLVEQKRKK